MVDKATGSSITSLNLQYLKAKRRVAELAGSSNLKIETIRVRNDNTTTSPTLRERKQEVVHASSTRCCSLPSVSNSQHLSSQGQDTEAILDEIVAPHNNNKIILNEIISHLTNEIRTAGLRKGRENALISLLNELKEEHQKLFQKQIAVCEQWTLHAEECKRHISSLQQQLLLCKDEKQRAETKTQLATEDCKKALLELETTRSECIVIREEAERVKNEAREQCAERKAFFKEETSRKIIELKQLLNKEKDSIKRSCIHDAQIERREIEKKWQEKCDSLEMECARLSKDTNQKCQTISALTIQLEGITQQTQKEKHDSVLQFALLDERLNNEQQALIIEREKHASLSEQNQMLLDRLRQAEIDRRLELQQIERKVKEAFDLKDAEYSVVIKHLNTVKKQIEELDWLTA